MSAHTKRQSQSNFWVLFCLGIFYASYLVIRYRGLWTENDTAIFTHDAILTARYHSFSFATQYPHGFGYQLWLAMMHLTTGLSTGFINTTILPFVGVSLAMVLAYVTYLELTEHLALSELSTLLILVVPDIMFTLLRGNHEKLTIILILAGVYTLVRLLKSDSAKERLLWEVAFYALMATNGVVNDYFTVVLIWGLLAYLLIGGIFAWRTGLPKTSTLRHVVRLIIISLAIIALDIGLIFPLAQTDIQLLIQTVQKVATLFTTQKAASNPLSAPVQQWADIPIYLVVSAFRWVTVFGSCLVWIVMVVIPLRRKESLPISLLIMISMYAATATLVAIAVPIDLSGSPAGSNLEVRNYTYFALFALPFVSLGISRLVPSTRVRPKRQKTAHVVGAVLIPIFLVMSILKATLDPAISNQWILYSPGEKQAVTFYLSHRGSAPSTLWAGPDQRLRNVAATWWPGSTPWYVTGGGQPTAAYPLWLWSPNIAANSVELKDPLPDFHGQNLVYNNGQAKIYAPRPASPFESLHD